MTLARQEIRSTIEAYRIRQRRRVLYPLVCACDAAVLSEHRAAGVRPVLPDPSESSNEVGSWLPPRPEEQVGRAPGGAALRGGVGGKGEAAAPIQVRSALAASPRELKVATFAMYRRTGLVCCSIFHCTDDKPSLAIIFTCITLFWDRGVL